MKNLLFILIIIFSLVSCTKDETIVTAQAVNNYEKFYLPAEEISPAMGEIYSAMQACDLEQSRSAYERFSSLSESEYIQYINFLAHDGAKKYGVSIDTAICILANRINYSEVLFGVMPNKLTLEQLEKVASFMHYAGLIISPDPSTWGNGKIEKDFVVTLVDKNPVYRKTAVFPAKSLKKDCYLNLATSSKDNFLIYMIGTQYLSVNSAKESLRLEYSLPMILITLDSEDFLSTLEVQLVCPTMKCKEKSPTTAMNNNL